MTALLSKAVGGHFINVQRKGKTMNYILNLMLCALLALAAGCATVDTAKAERGQGVSQTYDAPFDKVWDAVPSALSSLGINIVNANRADNTVLAEKGVSAFSWGEKVALFVTPVDEQRSKVEVISKRAMATNITATDWSKDILLRIGDALADPSATAWRVLEGPALVAYREFRGKPFPRAFVIADQGRWVSENGKFGSTALDPTERAMNRCAELAYTNCKLYAVDDKLVGEK